MPTNEHARTPGQIHEDNFDLHFADGSVFVMIEDMPVSMTPSGDLDFLVAAWNAADALGWRTPEDCARGVAVMKEMQSLIRSRVAYLENYYYISTTDRKEAEGFITEARALLAKLGGEG